MKSDDLRNNTFIGFVEDNQDPKKLGRCRIRVMYVFEEIPKEDIPWATPWKDLNGNIFLVPDVGKVVTVVFEGGNVYKPQYIYAEHYNINLEEKLNSLSGENYTSMRALMFDHKTQIYVNDEEGLKLDHKFNNINITKDTIDINLKDNYGKVNIGTKTAGQQAVLGNHFMDWLTEFVTQVCDGTGLVSASGGNVFGNSPLLILKQRFLTLKDSKFLSHHVNIVDNSYVTKLDRINNPQIGDKYKSNLTPAGNSGSADNGGSGGSTGTPTPSGQSGANDPTGSNSSPNLNQSPLPAPKNDKVDYKPQDGTADDTPDDDELLLTTNIPDYNSKVMTSGIAGRAVGPPAPTENKDVFMLLKALKKKTYKIFERPFEMNIVAIRKVTQGDFYTNAFSDDLYIFYKNDENIWQIHKYPISTMPGVYMAKVIEKNGKKSLKRDPNGVNVKTTEIMKARGGLGILKEMQYIDVYKIGLHNKSQAMVTIKEQFFYRDKTDGMRIVYSKEGRGSVGMFMHRGFAGGQSVNNWSEGCQVFKAQPHMNEFFEKCEIHKQRYGNKFSYTLMLKRDLIV